MFDIGILNLLATLNGLYSGEYTAAQKSSEKKFQQMRVKDDSIRTTTDTFIAMNCTIAHLAANFNGISSSY